jgi:hypothetical protein
MHTIGGNRQYGENNIKMNLNGIDYEIVGSIRVAYDS